jgi:hypothetical protein
MQLSVTTNAMTDPFLFDAVNDDPYSATGANGGPALRQKFAGVAAGTAEPGGFQDFSRRFNSTKW